jgi:hypothetical protein
MQSHLPRNNPGADVLARAVHVSCADSLPAQTVAPALPPGLEAKPAGDPRSIFAGSITTIELPGTLNGDRSSAMLAVTAALDPTGL